MGRESLPPREVEAALLQRLPIFPLPRAVLFPGIVVPLHLFEDRYRALAEHCVGGDRLMALPALRPGYEPHYEGRPPVFPIMGLGQVVAEQRLPDGRWNIALQGICRVELVEELPPARPFREVRARCLRDTEDAIDPLAVERLESVVIQLASSVPAARPQLDRLLTGVRSPAALADVAAGLFVERFAARRRLLEEPRVDRRLAILNDELAGLLLEAAFRGPNRTPPN